MSLVSQAPWLQNVDNLMCVIAHRKKPFARALIFTLEWQMSLAETCTESFGKIGSPIKSDTFRQMCNKYYILHLGYGI